jgi:glycine cleavage system aminomethyltransferase T
MNLALSHVSHLPSFFVRTIKNILFRTVYTCALNNRGGVEIDLTVTAIENGVDELNDPSFKGRGE